jgi:Spy/CpxP family protein refolding chaperone
MFAPWKDSGQTHKPNEEDKMKLQKFSLIAGLALGALLACTSVATAQDNKEKKEGAPGAGGGAGGRNMSPEARFEKMSTELNLTEDQKPKVKAALKEQFDKMKDLSPEERREKGPAMREEADKKMKEILTADQYKKFQSMRPGRPGGGGPGGPGGAGHKPEGDKAKKE